MKTRPASLKTPRQMMRTTLAALLPGIALMFITFGYGFAFNLASAVTASVATEAVLLKLRKVPPVPFLSDLSAVLTGVLIALALPPHLPWWIPAFAAVTAIAVGKQIYGGLGNNLFNPAMLGYCVVLVAWPLHLTAWPDADVIAKNFDFVHALQYAGSGSGEILAAAMSGATPLTNWRSGSTAAAAPIPWAMINAGFALGGLWLLFKGVISWHIPAAMLGVLVSAALVIEASPASLALHLGNGAAMLGAFFIATDPATSPRTPYAMLAFGGGVGLLLALIRNLGDYADGLAFAVLIMNAAVPLLDKIPCRHANR